MLKLSGSVCKLLFSTLLVFLCFNGEQLVYAETLVLDKKHLNATVEVPKVLQTTVDPLKTTTAPSSTTASSIINPSVTNPSTVTHSFDLKFDVGEPKDYPAPGKSFNLTIGSACNIQIKISDGTNNNKIFYINGNNPVFDLTLLTITNEKVTAYPKDPSQPSKAFCDGTSDPVYGGIIKLENPANDPGKSIIELKIIGADIPKLPKVFKLTSTAQIYVPPTSPPTTLSSSNVSNSCNCDDCEEVVNEKRKILLVIIIWCSVIGVITVVLAVYLIVNRVKASKKDNDDESENKKGSKQNKDDEPKRKKESKNSRKKRTITAEVTED